MVLITVFLGYDYPTYNFYNNRAELRTYYEKYLLNRILDYQRWKINKENSFLDIAPFYCSLKNLPNYDSSIKVYDDLRNYFYHNCYNGFPVGSFQQSFPLPNPPLVFHFNPSPFSHPYYLYNGTNEDVDIYSEQEGNKI